HAHHEQKLELDKGTYWYINLNWCLYTSMFAFGRANYEVSCLSRPNPCPWQYEVSSYAYASTRPSTVSEIDRSLLRVLLIQFTPLQLGN
ncbi:hypothetical protein M5D96_007712, partial [Drosophila gunungcola]